jgi:hypothetical protein
MKYPAIEGSLLVSADVLLILYGLRGQSGLFESLLD